MTKPPKHLGFRKLLSCSNDWDRLSVRAFTIFLFLFAIGFLLGEGSVSQAADTWFSLPQESPDQAITVRGDTVWRWKEGEYEVLNFLGGCSIEQGARRATAPAMMLWIEHGNATEQRPTRVIAYLEGGVEVVINGSTKPQGIRDHSWLGRFVSTRKLDIHAPTYYGPPAQRPSIYERMQRAHENGDHLPIAQTQYQLPAPANPPPSLLPPPTNIPAPPPVSAFQPGVLPPQDAAPPVVAPQPGVAPPPPANSAMQFQFGAQNVEIAPRGNGGLTRVQTFEHRRDNGETVLVASGGVTVLVRDVTVQPRPGEFVDLGLVTLSADRVVAWLPLFGGDRSLADGDGELYLEGDIVFRQGERIVYANRMYYNIRRSYGVVLEAEVITPIPDAAGNAGFARIKTEALQQLSKDEAVAYGAAVTTSRLGVPRYWLQTGEIRVRNPPRAAVDPISGLAVEAPRKPRISSSNNLVYLGGLPVFYWPTIATNLENPSFYVSGFSVNSDSIFGEQVMVDFDLYQILGWETAPDGTEWTLSTDYLSERGFALGTQYTYALPGIFGIPGAVNGGLDAWGIDDSGLDTLGIDRRNLVPEEDIRGRIRLHHRHQLTADTEFWADVGFISDRNFLEQYLESEWDQDPDQLTALRLRHYEGNQQFDLFGQVRVNEFFTENNSLPRFDHSALGISLLGDRLTWSARSRIGYEKLEVASTPLNAVEAAAFQLAPWEVEREGIRAITRQELAAPFELGAMKVVPYVSGEAGHWGETINQQDVTRLLGQTGVRTTLPMWAAFPNISSSLLNINGLAHKVEWRTEFLYADANEDLDEFPLYDPLDDNAQEHFRRRFATTLFPGFVLPEFDERGFAFRQGLQGNVTSPTPEIADDLMLAKLGIHQRLQTKRGLMGRERIVDLLQLDVDFYVFPKADRDNFGETAGPLTYDFRYHIGDRLSFLSDGYYDFFATGLKSTNGGFLWSRPALGDFYLGLLNLEGPISSTTIQAAVNYRLNEKWITSASTAVDLGNTGNIGQQLSVIRIGESLMLRLGVAVDTGRDNVSFQFGIEPRIWPKRRLGRLGGALIPPPGAEGLE